METEHPTPARPQPADVGRALADALVTDGSTTDLERLVRAYARDLRRDEVPPEQALPRIKEMVGLASPTPLRARSLAFDRLATQVAQWFVAEYYRAD
jgi:hypothetical protein